MSKHVDRPRRRSGRTTTINISVPNELYDQMKREMGDANWSKIASDAFASALSKSPVLVDPEMLARMRARISEAEKQLSKIRECLEEAT